MKRLLTKIVLAGLIASSAMPLQAFWQTKTTVVLKAKHGQNSLFNQLAQKMGNGLTYIKNSIYNASTETKLLVGCAALATAGISYLLYRHLNPTDQELIDAAQPYIRKAEDDIAHMPIIDPLDENRLNDIGGSFGFSLGLVAQDMSRSLSALKKQHAILKTRIIRYENAKQYTPIGLVDSYNTITPLIKALSDRINIINTHGHYFRLVGWASVINGMYTNAIDNKNNVQALVPVVRLAERNSQFPFLSFVKNVSSMIQSVSDELAERSNASAQWFEIYTKKRRELRTKNEDLSTVRTTVLGSPEYAADEKAKREHDATEARLKLERERLAQEAQKAADERWARQQELIIKQQELQLKQEKAARERQAYQQQHPNRPIVVQQVNAGCEVQ